MSKGYDSKCDELARHFLEDPANNEVKVSELAQHIQDAIENWIAANWKCPTCGSEERDHRGLLKCECPCPSTLKSRRRIAREMQETAAPEQSGAGEKTR